MPEQKTDLTSDEVASILRLSSRTIQEKARARIIPGAYKLGKQWRFDVAVFDLWRDKIKTSCRKEQWQPSTQGLTAKISGSGTLSMAERYENLLGLQTKKKRLAA